MTLCILFSACEQEGRDVGAFRHWVIDNKPDSGKDCCTDVLALGDLNGDGALDVVAGSQGASDEGLVWYQFPAWEKHPVAVGEFTTDGQTADIDGDGDLDIVTGTHVAGFGEVLWFENLDGQGTRWSRHRVGEAYAHDVVVGDVDGDGQLDLVTCDKNRLTLWLRSANGEFRGESILERHGEGTAIADLDLDGDLDIVFGAAWLENAGSDADSRWTLRLIAADWPADTRVVVADMNADGRPDVVSSVSEGRGPLAWFESPENTVSDPWVSHPVDSGRLEGAHSLEVSDLDIDGDPDILVAEMHTSPRRRVLVYRNDGSMFTPMTLSRRGSHNMRVADIDGDGDSDIVGKNYAGADRPIEIWENFTSRRNQYTYIAIDRARPRSEQGKMGIVSADVDRDGLRDVIAGAFWYRNPGDLEQSAWARALVADDGLDIFFASDIDGDRNSDLVGIEGTTVYWVEAMDAAAASWEARAVAELATGGRTQGYIVASLSAESRYEFVFTRGQNLYVLVAPNDPGEGTWPLHRISSDVEEAGIGAGDLDGDGDQDLAAVGADGHDLVWLENPGSLGAAWISHAIGEPLDSRVWLDRVAVADVNGDGRLDVLATEERQDWLPEAHAYWFEAPADSPDGGWIRHVIARHRSLNSMDVADIDGDGVPDISIAEHTDQGDEVAGDTLIMFYLNREMGDTWLPVVVERGPHSSHLGARLFDLNSDASLEIVSTGWNQYRALHLWRSMAP